MSSTTNWGDVELTILTQLQTLIPATVRIVKSATSEAAADKAALSAFPALIIVLQPISAPQIRATGRGGITALATARWVVYQYAQSGRTDSETRYGPTGIFAVNVAQREKLHGFYPAAQIDNSSILQWEGCSPLEPFGGTSGLKMSSTYALDQLIETI